MSVPNANYQRRFGKKIKPASAATNFDNRNSNSNHSGAVERSFTGSGKLYYCHRRGEESTMMGKTGSECGKPAILPQIKVFPERAVNNKKYVKNKRINMAVLPSSNTYKVRPVIQAKTKELVSVAKAMHREEFSDRIHKLFAPEKDAALEAMETGVYIGWRCPEYSWDCIRLSKHSRCFCDHNLSEHASYNGKSTRVKCLHANCLCNAFAFVPERPEDIGEWWLLRRPGFEPHLWRAKCRCKHTHDFHNPLSKMCTVRGCSCFTFQSAFLCAACDKHWEDHETFFDTPDTRKSKGLPYAAEYLPFHELPNLRNACLTGSETNDTVYQQLVYGPLDIPRHNPTPLSRQLARR